MIYVEKNMLNFDDVDLLEGMSAELSSLMAIIDDDALSTLVCMWCKLLLGQH